MSEHVEHLPKKTEFSRAWELALAKLYYPNSWCNVDGAQNHFIDYCHNATTLSLQN